MCAKPFSLGEKVAAYSPTDEGHVSVCERTAFSLNSDPHPPYEYSGHLLPKGEGSNLRFRLIPFTDPTDACR